jgi:hypothetical protein
MQGFYVKDKVMDDPFFMEKAQAKGDADTVYIRQIEKSLPIRWDVLKPDPVHVLLYHSDCDGQIEVKDLEPLAKRLDEIIPLLPDEDAGGHIGNWRDKTKQFAEGCRRALAANEPIEFH